MTFICKKFELWTFGLQATVLYIDTDHLQRIDGSRDHSHGKKHQPTLETRQRRDSSKSQSSPAKKAWVKPGTKKLSEEEKEQKRQEMMNNAKWREKEREKNIANYEAEDEKEKNDNKEYNGDFIRYTI